MSLSTKGLIIRVNNVKEYDRFISVLTETNGVIRAYVHGARSVKNKNAAATALLTFSHLTLERKKDTYVLKEASAEKGFFGLQNDIVKLTLAQHFCELANVLAPENTDSHEYLRLILNSLYYLENDKRPLKLIKAITELRMLTVSGYAPNLVACSGCARFEDDVMYFDTQNGELLCKDCKTADKNIIPISKSVLSAMRHIAFSPFPSLYNFTLSESSEDMLVSVVERFLLSQVEHKFSVLQFFKNL